MAFNDQSIYKSFIAGGSITAFQLVKLNNAGKVVVCTASTDVPVGVSQLSVSSGEVTNVCILGLTRVIAGEAITAGTDYFVMPGLAGRVYAYASGGAGEQIAAGRYLANDVNTAGADGEQIEILFSPCLGV
jgi:hypothetical protein